MEKLNRLICQYDKPVLHILLEGKICSGDLINFSYSLTRRVQKIDSPFFLFLDASCAEMNLMEGLAMRIFGPFIDDVIQKELIRASIMLPNHIFDSHNTSASADKRIRFFNSDFETALSWLSGSSEREKNYLPEELSRATRSSLR